MSRVIATMTSLTSRLLSALFGADETQLEAIYNTLYDLNEFVVPNYPNAHDSNWFKSYDDLKAKLETVLGLATGGWCNVEERGVCSNC